MNQRIRCPMSNNVSLTCYGQSQTILKLQYRSRLDSQCHPFGHRQCLRYNIMYSRVKRSILRNHTSNLHTILYGDGKFMNHFVGYVIARSLQYQSYLTTICTIVVHLEAYGVGTDVFAVATERLTESYTFIEDFHDGGVFVLCYLQGEADVLSLSPLVAKRRIEGDSLSGIGTTVGIAYDGIFQGISNQAQLGYAVGIGQSVCGFKIYTAVAVLFAGMNKVAKQHFPTAVLL